MNWVDITIVAVVLLLAALAIRSSLKKSCSGDCGGCGGSCSTGHKSKPVFVEQYRKDHPKH
jgi:hypothetical protein